MTMLTKTTIVILLKSISIFIIFSSSYVYYHRHYNTNNKYNFNYDDVSALPPSESFHFFVKGKKLHNIMSIQKNKNSRENNDKSTTKIYQRFIHSTKLSTHSRSGSIIKTNMSTIHKLKMKMIPNHILNNNGDDRLMIMCLSFRGGGAGSEGSTDEDTRTITSLEDKSDSTNKTHENETHTYHIKNPSTSNNNVLPNTVTISEKLALWKNETTSKTTLFTEKAKRLFLDKITVASTLLLNSEINDVGKISRERLSNYKNNIKNRNKHVKKKQSDGEENDNGDDDVYNNDYEETDDDDKNDDDITFQSDLLRPGRSFHIVTTASIPWFTGTAVNPLLRAAYLCRLMKKINHNENHNSTTTANTYGNTTMNGTQLMNPSNYHKQSSSSRANVTLVIPWLELEEDRIELYGTKYNFSTPEEQEAYIRQWLRVEADMPDEANEQTGLQIVFYPARYHTGLKSIFAMGDMVSLLFTNTDCADVCILEEPEHLNFYRAPGDGWTKKFNYVIGIIHTNYVEYASSHYSGLWTAPAIRVMSSAMVRAYCHVVIKLSDTLQIFAEEKERISNVHGVRSEFLREGSRRSREMNDSDLSSSFSSNKSSNNANAYFIGKLLWTKGLDGLLDMESYYKRMTGKYFPIDIYGNGPDERAIKRAFLGRSQTMRKNDGTDMDQANNFERSHEEFVNYNNETTTSYEEALEDSFHKTSMMISHHVAKLSKQIQATTQTLKSSTESFDLDLPQSLHEYRRTPIPAKFPGRVDHATLKQYKIFVNPSLSEVLCTTTAEALAMGKFVIIPVHPSNHFFMQFPNCLGYRNKLEFAANLSWALSHDPEPLTEEQQRIFTWEAATERLVQASAITRREAKERQKLGFSRLDDRIAWFHNEMGNGAKGDILRKVLGAGPAANQFKYSKQRLINDSEADEDDEGLSIKFVRSSLADALRKTFSNGIFAPVGTFSG